MSISRELDRLTGSLNSLNNFRDDLKIFTKTGYSTNETDRSDKPTDFFALYNRLKNSLDTRLMQNHELDIHINLNFGAETVLWLQER
jgi:hypothetical protein